jgi:hypothetical protein
MTGAKNVILDALNAKGGNMHCLSQAKRRPLNHVGIKLTLMVLMIIVVIHSLMNFPLITEANRVIRVTDCEQN